MVSSSGDEIIGDLFRYMDSMGGAASKWYVGIGCDAESWLFQHHRLHRSRDRWIWRLAESTEEALSVVRFFVEAVGTDGYPCASVPKHARLVYAFRRRVFDNA